MMRNLMALGAGIVFGLGLAVSQMIDPAKVLGFLDLAGDWDPSLAFVMAGAVGVSFFGFRLARRRGVPILAESFHLPRVTDINLTLVGGAAVFGVGWGLVGLCPGPAIAVLALGYREPVIFFVALVAGIGIANLRPVAPLPNVPAAE